MQSPTPRSPELGELDPQRAESRQALLAHDNPEIRSQLARTLEKRGWTVSAAAGGAEAWARFQSARFPLAVLATSLSRVNGLELCRRIRSSPVGAGCQVLLVAGCAEAATEAVAAGADDFICAPFAAPELDARIAVAEHRLADQPEVDGDDGARIRDLEHALRMQGAFLAELFESAPEAVAVVDGDDHIVQINREFSRLFGYTPEEAVGRPINALIAPGELFEDAYDFTLRTMRGERVVAEAVRARKDGTRLHVSMLASPVRVGSGQLGTYGIYRDVTEAKRAAAEIDRREREIRALVEHTPDIIGRLDRDFRVLYVTPSIETALGLPASALIGNRLNDLNLPPDVGECLHRAIEQTFRTAQPQAGIELCYPGPDGDRFFDNHFVPEPGENAPVETVLAVARDATERHLAVTALEQSEQRYRALFEQSPVGVFLVNDQQRVTHCNDQLLDIMAVRREQLIGLNLGELHETRVRELFAKLNVGGLKVGDLFYEGPYQMTLNDRQLFISAHARPLRGPHGEYAGAICVVEDVTEREEAQVELRQQAEELATVNAELRERSEQVEAAMQARNRFYARMSHELRTPLSAIMLYNELLLGGTMGELSPEQQDGIVHSQDAAVHLLELVHDVLDLSKIEAHKISLNVEPVALPELLRMLLATVRPLAWERGSELHVVTHCDSCTLFTDPRRVRQILLNLLSNAVRFGRGKPITITCGPAEAGGVTIEVRDQGIGIPPEELPRIFEDFVQVGEHQEGGTGLGLSISQRLTELLGGTLTVESVPGEGSTFRLELPLRPPAERHRASAQPNNG